MKRLLARIGDWIADLVVGIFFHRYIDSGRDQAYPTVFGVFVISGLFGYMTWVTVEASVEFVSLWGFWFGPFVMWNQNGFRRHMDAYRVTRSTETAPVAGGEDVPPSAA